MVTNSFPQTGQLYPINPDGSFVVSNVPFSSSGMAYYSGTASGSLDLSGQDTIPSISGTVHVTNEVATVHMSFGLLETFYENSGGILITGYATFLGTVNATGPSALPRFMVWDATTSSNWNTNDANWNNGAATWNDGRVLDGAIFNGAGLGTVSLTQPIVASFIDFTASGYNLGQGAGGTLTLLYQSAITNNGNNTISASIVSTNGLNIYGSGDLTLSGANTYSGPTIINSGVLEYGSGAAVSTSRITVPNGSEVYFDSGCAGATISAPMTISGVGVNGGALHTFVPGGAITFTGPITLAANSQIYGQSGASSTINLNSIISGNYAVTFFGGDVVPGTTDQDTFVLGAANTYGGATYITNYGASAEVQLSGGNNRLPTGTTVYMSAGAYDPANSSLLDLNGHNQTLANLQDGPVTAGIRSVLSSSGPGTLTLSNAMFSGTLDGQLALTKVGAGTVTLSGASTYSGPTVISAGTVALSGSGTLGSASSGLTIAAGATLDVSAVTGGSWSLSGSTALTANGTASPSTINSPFGGTVSLGAQPVIMPSYDGTHPPLTIAGTGSLALNDNPFTVNTISPLGVSTYPLIQVAS